MKGKLVLILLLCLSTICVDAQKDNSYFGKKIILQPEIHLNYPFFNNLTFNRTPYGVKGNNLVEKKDLFNFGYRLNAGYVIKRNFAMLVEFGQDFSSIYPLNDQSIYYEIDGNSYYYDYLNHEMVDVTTTVIMPKFEVATLKALLPMGLSHQFGIGITLSKANEKNYTYESMYYDDITYEYISTSHKYNTSSTDLDPINFDKIKTIKKLMFMYGLSMRTPITKNLLLSYGLKYTVSLGPSSEFYMSTVQGNEAYTAMIEKMISKHRTISFINLNLGLTFVF